jgi:hypothetical protein
MLVMKKKDERKLHIEEMRMMRWKCGITRMNRIRNNSKGII